MENTQNTQKLSYETPAIEVIELKGPNISLLSASRPLYNGNGDDEYSDGN